jgi:hypothetical protein
VLQPKARKSIEMLDSNMIYIPIALVLGEQFLGVHPRDVALLALIGLFVRMVSTVTQGPTRALSDGLGLLVDQWFSRHLSTRVRSRTHSPTEHRNRRRGRRRRIMPRRVK